MIDSLFVMTENGDVLIEKHWRGHQPRAICETFFDHVRKEARPEDTCPVISSSDCFMVHIYRKHTQAIHTTTTVCFPESCFD